MRIIMDIRQKIENNLVQLWKVKMNAPKRKIAQVYHVVFIPR